MNWLILRGLVREQRHWGEFKGIFETEIKKMNPGNRIVTLDFPGFGTEVRRLSPRSIHGIVEDLRTRWEKLKSTGEEWGMLAISLGGMVSADWVSRFPSDFKKLVMINSSMSGISPIYHRMYPRNYPYVLKLLLSRDLVEREKKILSMTTNLDPTKIHEKARLQAEFGKGINRINAVNQMIAAVKFRAPEKIQIPTLVLVGQGDRLVSPLCSEAIAKKYGAEIRRHPTAGHDLATDEPRWIIEQILNWNSSGTDKFSTC